MEPRPQRPRPQSGAGAPNPGGAQPPRGGPPPEGAPPGGYPEGVDPATFIAPPRTEYDYSPLDLAPPGQRRRRQFVAAAIGGLTVLLIGAVAVFSWLLFGDNDPSDDENEVIAAQTELAQSRSTIAAQETIVAQAAAEQTTIANGGATQTADGTPPPDESAEATEPPADNAAAAADAEGTEPPAAADATEPAAADEAAAGDGAFTIEELQALLPAAEAVPEGLDGVEDISRTSEEVVDALGSSRTAETNLEDWGWVANVERQFSASDPTVLEPDAPAFLRVSVHGFGTPEAAAEALPFFADVFVNASGSEEIDAPDLGDSARLFTSTAEDGTTNVTLYVQQGTVMYLVAGSSPAGDPTETVTSVTEAVLREGA